MYSWISIYIEFYIYRIPATFFLFLVSCKKSENQNEYKCNFYFLSSLVATHLKTVENYYITETTYCHTQAKLKAQCWSLGGFIIRIKRRLLLRLRHYLNKVLSSPAHSSQVLPSLPGTSNLVCRASDFVRFQISDFGFQILDFRFWISDFGFPILDFRCRASDFIFFQI